MSASGFQVARVPPLLGRYLVEEDMREGAAPVVVIGYDVWQSRFAGDPEIPLEPFMLPLALVLRQLAGQLVRVEAVAVEHGGHEVHVVARVAEDDRALRIVDLEDLHQELTVEDALALFAQPRLRRGQTAKPPLREMGVDPALALAHAYQESGFNQAAVSPANAIGAMQVIPSSGEWASQLVGRELNLLDPYDNATAGVAIIRALRSSSHTVDGAIASYYQGQGSVRRNGMYPDTRRYVASVKAHMARFA